MSYKDDFIENIEKAITQYDDYKPHPESYDRDEQAQEAIAWLEERFNEAWNPKARFMKFKYLKEDDVNLWDWTLLFEDWLELQLN